MPADIGAKIGMQGEAKLRQELKEIATGYKTLRAEADAVTSSFIGNEKSIEALAAKNDVLERTAISLREQLEKEQELLQLNARAFGEADSRTQALQQTVYKTTTALNKCEAEIKQNTTAMQKLDSAQEEVTGSNNLLQRAADALGSKLGLSSSQTEKLTKAFGSGAAEAALFGAALVKVGQELVKLSDAAAAHADDVESLATKYNLSAGDIQKFQYMSELVDVSVETLTGGITKLTRSMDSARAGTGDAAASFEQLGVRVTNSDGTLRNAREVFLQTIDALGRVGNETERDALAMSLFGKSAADLNPLIAQGSANLRALAEEAENSGYVMSDQMVAVLANGDDATQRLNRSMEGLKNTIGAGVTPIVAGWKYGLAEAADTVAVLIQKLAGLRDESDGVAEATKAASDAIVGVRELTKEDLAYGGLSQKAQDYYTWQRETMRQAQESGITNGQFFTYEQYLRGTGVAKSEININFEGSLAQLGRVLQPVITGDGARVGATL